MNTKEGQEITAKMARIGKMITDQCRGEINCLCVLYKEEAHGTTKLPSDSPFENIQALALAVYDMVNMRCRGDAMKAMAIQTMIQLYLILETGADLPGEYNQNLRDMLEKSIHCARDIAKEKGKERLEADCETRYKR